MTDTVEVRIFHPTLAEPHLPPLPPDGGGFFYIKRESDRMVLMNGDWYWEFETQAEALTYIARNLSHLQGKFLVCFMPKMRVN